MLACMHVWVEERRVRSPHLLGDAVVVVAVVGAAAVGAVDAVIVVVAGVAVVAIALLNCPVTDVHLLGIVSTSARVQGVRGAKQAARPRRVWFVCACVPATGCGRCLVLSCAAKRLGGSGQLLLGSGCCQECVRGVSAGRVVVGDVLRCASACAGGGRAALSSRLAGVASSGR